MTMAQDAARGTVDTGHTGSPATGRQRVAAGLVLLVAVAMLVTAILGIGKFHSYQVVLDVVAVILLVVAAGMLARRGVRWPAILVTWLSVLGVIAEFGDYQSKKNETGALSATNTSYFLPDLLWLFMALLIVAAVVITSMSAAPKGLRD